MQGRDRCASKRRIIIGVLAAKRGKGVDQPRTVESLASRVVGLLGPRRAGAAFDRGAGDRHGGYILIRVGTRKRLWRYRPLFVALRDSIASQIATARSGPPSRLMARMPVGEVTLISVR